MPVEIEGKKESIFLVEDNADVRAFAAAVLDNLNYTVIEAETGDDALVMFEKMPIDLIIQRCPSSGLFRRQDVGAYYSRTIPGIAGCASVWESRSCL